MNTVIRNQYKPAVIYNIYNYMCKYIYVYNIIYYYIACTKHTNINQQTLHVYT